MKILLLALGSRGDVQPFLGLAVGLRDAGHHVTLAAPYSDRAWVEAHGIHFHPARFNPHEMLQRPEVQAIVKSRNVARQMRVITEVVGPGLLQSLDDFWEASATADFVVQTGTGFGGSEIAQLRKIPMAMAFLQPFAPTREFPSFFLPARFSLGGWYNRLTYTLTNAMLWPAMGPPANEWRRTRFNLKPYKSLPDIFDYARQTGAPVMHGYSPSALPKPRDWAAHLHVTGYWFLDAPPAWQPAPELLRFLESGPPPIYIGFGSMRDDDPARLTRLILRALELSGQRGILLTGWGALAKDAPSDKVFFVDNVPHAWLFPRMAAVVHHGGAGTTGAGFRSGVPSLITPFALDQYAWAGLATQLGVRPPLGEMKTLTAEKLANAMQAAVNDTHLRAQAATLGANIRAENGVARAIELIERHAATFNP